MPSTISDMNRQAAAAAAAAEEERKRKAREEAARKEREQRAQREKAAQDRAAASKANTPKATAPKAQTPAPTAKAAGVASVIPPPIPAPLLTQVKPTTIQMAPALTSKPGTAPKPVLNGSRQDFVDVQRAITQAPRAFQTKKPEEMTYIDYAALGRRTGGGGKGKAFFDELSEAMKNPGSGLLYNPYYGDRSTLQWAIDAFEGKYQNFDDNFFKETEWLQDEENRLPDTLNISKAGMKNWTKTQLQAYARNVLEMHREATEQAATQWSDLMTRAQDFYQTYEKGYGRKPTIDEFLASIDISKYSMLQKMDESRNIGAVGSSAPVILTRGIGYSHENLYGLYQALNDGQTLDPTRNYFEDAVKYASRLMLPEYPGITEPPKARYGSDHANNAASMSPSQVAAAREEIRTIGNRQSDAEFTEALYAKTHPEYSSYGIPPYTDDAYYAENAAKFQDIIDSRMEMDLNGQGTFPKPSKDDPPSVWQAYTFWQRTQWEPDTKKVEAQWDAYVNRLKAWYPKFKSEVDSGEMDLTKEIDLKDYPELSKFMDGTGKITTTRPVYASQEAIQGIIEALKDGQTEFNPDVDYAYYKAGQPTAQAPTQGGSTTSQGASGQAHGGEGNRQFQPVQEAPVGAAAAIPGINGFQKIGPMDGVFNGWFGGPEARAQAGLSESAPVTTFDFTKVPESAWPLLTESGVITQGQIDEYKAQQKANESTGMVEGEFKAQAAENPDTTKMSKEALLTTLKETVASIEGGKLVDLKDAPNPVVFEHEDQMNKLASLRATLTDALKQMGMTDEEIAAAIGPQLYTDSGENVTLDTITQLDKRLAMSDQANMTNRKMQAKVDSAEAVRQRQIDGVRQQLRELDINIDPTDPVAMDLRNKRFAALSAKLRELDFGGPTIEAAPEGGVQEVKTWRAPKNLEDVRTGILDWSADVSKKPAWGLLEINKKLIYDPTVAVINKIVDEFKRVTGQYPTTAEEWKNIHAAEEQAKQGQTDTAMDISRNYWRQTLPIDAPEFTVEFLSYLSTLGSVAGERTASGFARVGQNTADLFVELYMINNKEKFEKELGKEFTIDQARATDPTLNAALLSAEHWRHETAMLSPDVTKSLGAETNMVLQWYDSAEDIYLMSSVGSALTSGINGIVNGVINEALPYFAKLPSSVQKLAALTGKTAGTLLKPVGWFAKNLHYELRAYSSYAKEAREMGKTEDEVHQYGLLGMFTNGIVEGVLGKQYEKVLDAGFRAMMPRAVRTVSDFLVTNKKPVLEFLGDAFKNALGESVEESTEVLIQAIGKSAILHEAQNAADIADQAWQNAVGGFGGSLIATLLLGLGGGAGIANQRQAERIALKVLSDPKASQYTAGAAAIYIQKYNEMKGQATKPAAEAATAPVEAPKAPAEEKVKPEAKPAQAAPAAPVTASMNPEPQRDVSVAAPEPEPVKMSPEPQRDVSVAAPETPPASPQAQELATFVQNVEAAAKEEGIKEEVNARVEEEVAGGLLASFESPTEPTYFAILQADNAMNALDRELQNIQSQIDNGQINMEKMVRDSVKNLVPVEAGNPKKISWNLTEMIDRLGREKDKALAKIEDAKAQMKLLYDKWNASRDEVKNQRAGEIEVEVRDQVATVDEQRQAKADVFGKMLKESGNTGENSEGYINDLTKTPNEDNLGWVNESEEDPGWGNSRQKEEAETSWQTMDREKNEEVRAKGRGGAEGLDDKLANRRAALGTGGPKDGKGIPMVEVPKKIYDDMLQKFKGVLGSFMGPKSVGHMQGDKDTTKSNFATRTVNGAPSQYELTLKERGLKEKTYSHPMTGMLLSQDGTATKIRGKRTKTWLDSRQGKHPNKVDTMSPVKRAWKEGGYQVVAQNMGYYILEDLGYTRKNLGLMAWQDDLEGIARDNGVDMSGDINSVKQNFSPRYYVINRSFESDPAATNESGFPIGELAKYNPEELAVYSTTDMDEAMGVIDGKWQDKRVPRQGGTTYYVSQDVLAQFNDKYAALTEQDKAAMSYEEYSAMVSGMIDQYAQEHNLTAQERGRLYGAKNLFTKAGKPGWVVLDTNPEYVLFANEKNTYDPMVNANVKSVEQGLAALRAAANQQEFDRTSKNDKTGEWRTTSYHDEKTRNPKFQPDGRKSPEGTYYTREGSIIYAYNFTDPNTGKIVKLTAKMGAMDDADKEYGRKFVPLEQILADAYSIDVNTFFGNHRVNFTLERNYGQAQYGEFELGTVTDEGEILRDMTREIESFTQLIDNPDIALPMRQRFMRNLLDAQIKQTEKELYDLAESIRGGINPDVNQAAVNQYAYLKERQKTLGEMKKALTGEAKAQNEALGAAAKTFYDSLAAIDSLESQVTYDGLEADMAALNGIVESMKKADTPDTANMAFEQIWGVKTRIESALSQARRTIGGGALLGEYEWRIRSLDAKIKEVQADTSLSVDAKALRVKTLQDQMQRYTDRFYDMTSNEVDFTTPSQLVIEDGSEATYDLTTMSLPALVQLRESTRVKADREMRQVTRKAGSDTTKLQKYRALLAVIDAALTTMPKPAPSVSSTADGQLPIEAKPEVRRGPTGKQPLTNIEPTRITADRLQNPKDTRDTSGSQEAAVKLIQDLFGIDAKTLDQREAGILMNRLSSEAQATSRAYLTAANQGMGGVLRYKLQGGEAVDRESNWWGDKSGNMPTWLSDAFHEAENLLSNIYAGNDPFAAPSPTEEQTEVQNETPVGEGGNEAESVAEHPVVSAIIEGSEADETTKADTKEHAKSVAFNLTVPVTHSEVINASMAESRTIAGNPPAEETPVGNEQPAPAYNDPQLGPEGLPEYNGPVVYPKPTDVHSARETVASFVDELPVPVPEDEGSALLRRLRTVREGKNPVTTEQEPAKPQEKPKSMMTRVTDSELQNRLKYYEGLTHEKFPIRPPRDMADVLGYRQRRYRLGQEISAMTKNIDKLADELKKVELTDAQRDDLESKKAAIVVRRDSLKVHNRLINRALKDEDAYQIQEFDEAITAARKYGKSVFVGQRSGDRALMPENEMDQIDKGLAEMSHGEIFGASKKTALDALMRTRTLKALTMNREIANAITADAYRTQEQVELLKQRIEALDTLAMLSGPNGSEAMWADANARRLEKQAALLESDIIRMQEAADLYYRDSSTDAETALFGNSKSGGSLPTSLGHTIMTMIKHGVGGQAGIIRASGKWVGEVINRAIETNPERIVENFLGKYAPIFNRVYIDPVAEGNQKIKTTAQRFYDAIIKSGITMENEAIAHQYAEGRINFGELMAARPNDYKQIDEGIKTFRKIYDELIDDVNQTLTRNGFAPVAKRKDYFPHFKDGASGILSLIGLEENQDNIPLSMLGKTDEYRPLKQFVGNFLARKGNETDFGLITGAMRYIPSVLQVIHQTNNIVRLRQLEEMLSQTDTSELTPYQVRRLGHLKQYMMNYTNHISGKKTGVDVLVGKSAIGREGLDFLRKVKQYRGLSLTFGSPTVILSQLVSLGVSVAVAPTATAMAMAEMLHIVKDGDKAFDRDAFEARSQFLTRKYQGRPIPLTAWDNLMEKGQLPAEHLERIVSNVFVRAVYLQNVREGMADGPAMELADKIAWRAMSSRNKGETGIAYGNVVGGTVLQFGREAVNNIMFMIKDMPRLSPDRRKNFARMALLLLYNWLFNWMTGKQTAFDPIGAIKNTVENPEEGDTAWDTGIKALGAVADTGWPVSFDFTNGAQNLPVVAGVRNIGTAIGNFKWDDPTAYERLVSAGLGFFPGGAQIERTYRSIKTQAKGYSESNLGDVRFPVTQNPADLILSILVGDRAYGIGRWYRETNRKPLTNDQQEEFYKQYDAGIAPQEAFDAAIKTTAATHQTIDAKNATKMGDARLGYDMEKEAAKARSALGAPSGMPSWAYNDYAANDANVKKAIKAYGSSNDTGLIPREVTDYVELSGKRVPVTDENRAYLEDRQRKWFQAYMDELGPTPTPQEVKNAVAKADNKAKTDFLNKYWAEVG